MAEKQQHYKILVGLLVAVMLFGFFLLTPRGQDFREKYLNKHLSTIGSFLKGITSRATTVGTTGELGIMVSGINPVEMDGQEFSVRGTGFDGILIYDYITLNGGFVTFADSEVTVGLDSMVGTVSFSGDRIQISGKTDNIRLNDLSYNKTNIEFTIVGSPTSYALYDVSKPTLTFEAVSGTLTWSGLRGIPPLLNNDKLELFDFQGNMEMDEGSISLLGTVIRMKLNGVTIGLS